jgi:hypothetical protein
MEFVEEVHHGVGVTRSLTLMKAGHDFLTETGGL